MFPGATDLGLVALFVVGQIGTHCVVGSQRVAKRQASLADQALLCDIKQHQPYTDTDFFMMLVIAKHNSIH